MVDTFTVIHPTIRCPKHLVKYFQVILQEIEYKLENSSCDVYLCHEAEDIVPEDYQEVVDFILENIGGKTFWHYIHSNSEAGTISSISEWQVNQCRLEWLKWLVNNPEYDD